MGSASRNPLPTFTDVAERSRPAVFSSTIVARLFSRAKATILSAALAVWRSTRRVLDKDGSPAVASQPLSPLPRRSIRFSAGLPWLTADAEQTNRAGLADTHRPAVATTQIANQALLQPDAICPRRCSWYSCRSTRFEALKPGSRSHPRRSDYCGSKITRACPSSGPISTGETSLGKFCALDLFRGPAKLT